MPQLDKITFYSQVFWLLVVFFSLHFVFLKNILPKIAAGLKYRSYVISSYTQLQQEVSAEQSKLLIIQNDTFFLPINKFLLYFTSSELDILLMSRITSINFQNFLYSNHPTISFEKQWLNFSCRNDLKII